MKKNLKRIIFLAIFLIVLILPYLVFAQTNKGPLGNMEKVGTEAGYKQADETTISSFAGTIVNTAFGFLGVIFIGLTIYAGFLWMTAQGESDKVDQAKKIIKNCIIGLVLLISAYGIYAVVARIMDATSQETIPAPSEDASGGAIV